MKYWHDASETVYEHIVNGKYTQCGLHSIQGEENTYSAENQWLSKCPPCEYYFAGGKNYLAERKETKGMSNKYYTESDLNFTHLLKEDGTQTLCGLTADYVFGETRDTNDFDKKLCDACNGHANMTNRQDAINYARNMVKEERFNKIDAIKYLRDNWGERLGLKEAKDIADGFFAEIEEEEKEKVEAEQRQRTLDTESLLLYFAEKIFDRLPGDTKDMFYGGSRRFGYNTEQSDLDVFFYIPAYATRDADTLLINIGAVRVSTGNYVTPSSKFHLGGLDISVIDNRQAFLSLANEHDAIQDMLKTNPKVKTIIQELRPHTYHDGKAVYNALLKASDLS